MFYALGKKQEEFIDKINLFIAVGPASKVGPESEGLRNVCKYIWEMETFCSLFGIYILWQKDRI
jgi:hypothetical protein